MPPREARASRGGMRLPPCCRSRHREAWAYAGRLDPRRSPAWRTRLSRSRVSKCVRSAPHWSRQVPVSHVVPTGQQTRDGPRRRRCQSLQAERRERDRSSWPRALSARGRYAGQCGMQRGATPPKGPPVVASRCCPGGNGVPSHDCGMAAQLDGRATQRLLASARVLDHAHVPE
jgi:hypothetical protein